MPVTFEFNKSTELLPPHDAEVVYIETSEFYSTYDFKFAQVEWQWEEVDEEGPFGTSYVYEPNEPQPPNTVLSVIVDSCYLDKDGKCGNEGGILWALCDAIEFAIDNAGV